MCKERGLPKGQHRNAVRTMNSLPFQRGFSISVKACTVRPKAVYCHVALAASTSACFGTPVRNVSLMMLAASCVHAQNPSLGGHQRCPLKRCSP